MVDILVLETPARLLSSFISTYAGGSSGARRVKRKNERCIYGHLRIIPAVIHH